MSASPFLRKALRRVSPLVPQAALARDGGDGTAGASPTSDAEPSRAVASDEATHAAAGSPSSVSARTTTPTAADVWSVTPERGDEGAEECTADLSGTHWIQNQVLRSHREIQK